ncbi:MAG: hypothetical protein JSS49_14260 [Planctomycetes bacterium]|nr:hypothetical protein [Planctomycetota bacterium]
MDSNAVFAILLLFVGIGILTAEVFIPSGGLLGVCTFLTLIVSIVFAYRAWGTTNPNIFWAFCFSLLLAVPTVLSFAFYILPRTPMGKRVLLEAPSLEQLTPFAKETRHLVDLVGQYGHAITPLTPGGLISVNGERLHAISDGLVIEAGQSVEVIEVRGSRLRVRPGEPPPPDEVTENPEPSSRLDFEIPQS